MRLRPYHLALSAVELKGVTAQLPALARAVTATSVWEQRAAATASLREVARQRADSVRAQANGLAAGYRSVAPMRLCPTWWHGKCLFHDSARLGKVTVVLLRAISPRRGGNTIVASR